MKRAEERRGEGKDGLEKPNKGEAEWRGMELSVFSSDSLCFQCNLWTCLWVWDQHDGQFGTSAIWHTANDVLQSGFVIMTAVCVFVCE